MVLMLMLVLVVCAGVCAGELLVRGGSGRAGVGGSCLPASGAGLVGRGGRI